MRRHNSNYIKALQEELEAHRNEKIAHEQSAYMRNLFSFYGIKTTERRAIAKPFIEKRFLPSKQEAKNIVMQLWQLPQREYHYVAQELMEKYKTQFEQHDIELFEYMITTNSWWDTVDFIAAKLVGAYFKKYPKQKEVYCKKWLASNNMWLQRTAVIFQLKYKETTDVLLLQKVIQSLLGSKEFFINKAIGWALREYSKTNPLWVVQFVENTTLNNLSKKEALRLIN
jgi:3-methyladenine DNA glycosylase AlkD